MKKVNRRNGKDGGVAVEVLTPKQIRKLLDEQAERYLGMSGEEFIRLWKAGKLDVEKPHVLQISMLVPQSA